MLGITYTVNDDGSVTVNGTTSNSTSGFLLNTNISYFEVGKTYTVSGTKGDVHVAVLFGGVTWQLDTFTITEEMMNADEISVRITVEANTTVNNVTIYPQLELGSTATEYEPYRGNTATITSGLPLCSVGDVCDKLIYNADGTGKIIKRIRKVVFDGSENWGQMNTVNKKYRYAVGIGSANLAINNENFTTMSPSLMKCDIYATIANDYIYLEQNGIAINHTKGNGSTIFIYDENWATATIDEWKAHLAENPLTVIYVLNTPQVIELSATEMTELSKLNTLIGHTEIFNSGNAVMDVKYLGGYNEQAQTIGFWNSKKE